MDVVILFIKRDNVKVDHTRCHKGIGKTSNMPQGQCMDKHRFYCVQEGFFNHIFSKKGG
jgi:hypothetical protein